MALNSNSIIIKKSGNALIGGRGPRVAIPGVFPSTSQFGEQVVKFRVPSLDSFIGGGVPIGSVCVIIDEFPSNYGNMVLKSFIADGASYNHKIFIASRHIAPDVLANELPTMKKSSTGHDPSLGVDEDSSSSDLKIAWRYGQSHQSSLGSRAGVRNADANSQSFDFSKKSSVSDLGGKHLYLSECYSDANLISSSSDFLGDQLLQEIQVAIEDLDCGSLKPVNNVARICISHCEELILSKHFLLRLRSILRHTNSCAVITMSDSACYTSKAVSAKSMLAKVEHLSDVVIYLQSIVDQKRRDELGGIDGICNIKKVASTNSLKIFESPKDIGVSFKKKRLLFHELHLPPEGETTTQRETSSSSAKSVGLLPATQSKSSGCSTSFMHKGKSLDF